MSPTTEVYAVDFESYYDDNVSIRPLGAWHYLRHPQQDIYMVSVVGPKGAWVGNPLDFDWDSISGAIWVAHNLQFESAVFQALKEKHPDLSWGNPAAMYCTSDLAAYCGSGRSLKEAAKNFLGVELSKDTRDNMKGKRWSEMSPEFRKEVELYALRDSKHCLELWHKLSPEWPEHERELSLLNIEMGQRGIRIDVPKLEASIALCKRLLWETEQKIPWAAQVGTKDEDGKVVALLSMKQLAKACRKEGIEPPTSLAKDSEELESWLAQYGERFPWVRAISLYRRYNTLTEKFSAMMVRTRPTDGRMGFALKYAGAHTLRASGDAGVNMQNLPRLPFYITPDGSIVDDPILGTRGCLDFRSLLIPEPGHVFISADCSQIEARVIAWLAGDYEFLKACETGISPYMAHAIASMGWKGGDLKKEDPKTYLLAKARTLALGFGSGASKLLLMAKMYGVPEEVFDAPLDPGDLEEFEEYLSFLAKRGKVEPVASLKKFQEGDETLRRRWCNSWKIVQDYRATNPKIVALWERLEKGMRASVGGDYQIELPSGRHMTYRKVSTTGGLSAVLPKNGRYVREKQYGGRLAENAVQAAARDIFMEALLRVHKAGFQVVLQVHDELVCEVPRESAEAAKAEIVRLMTIRPEWAKTCPIAVEAEIMEAYKK